MKEFKKYKEYEEYKEMRRFAIVLVLGDATLSRSRFTNHFSPFTSHPLSAPAKAPSSRH